MYHTEEPHINDVVHFEITSGCVTWLLAALATCFYRRAECCSRARYLVFITWSKITRFQSRLVSSLFTWCRVEIAVLLCKHGATLILHPLCAAPTPSVVHVVALRVRHSTLSLSPAAPVIRRKLRPDKLVTIFISKPGSSVSTVTGLWNELMENSMQDQRFFLVCSYRVYWIINCLLYTNICTNK